MPNLAYLGQVITVYPIHGADRIESLEVVCGKGGRWRGTAKKSEFAVGELCEVYLQDALLPQTERYAFLEQRGWRVRMMRLRGVPSECLIMPLTEDTQGLEPGTDITELAGVTKYEKPLPANIGGDIRGNFPPFIPKTDEPNFQSVPAMIEALIGQPFYATVKADGSSGTIFWDDDGVVRACSRNFELKDGPTTAVWQLVRKYDLARHRLPIALQFEIVGPGIQKNALGLKEVDLRLFNVWRIDQRRYLDFDDMLAVAQSLGLPMVELVEIGDSFGLKDDEALRQYAERTYTNGATAEGVVIRPMKETRVNGERLSFKVINLLYRD
ncbi:MAG: RNA ligase family protein [Anaerolineae bacterium]